MSNPNTKDIPAITLKFFSAGILMRPIASKPPRTINPRKVHAPKAIARAGPTVINNITKMAIPIYLINFTVYQLL